MVDYSLLPCLFEAIYNFSLGGSDPTRALFGKNVCKNERIGSRGGGAPPAPPGSANITGWFSPGSHCYC